MLGRMGQDMCACLAPSQRVHISCFAWAHSPHTCSSQGGIFSSSFSCTLLSRARRSFIVFAMASRSSPLSIATASPPLSLATTSPPLSPHRSRSLHPRVPSPSSPLPASSRPLPCVRLVFVSRVCESPLRFSCGLRRLVALLTIAL